MFDLMPFLTAVTLPYFGETVQCTIATPTKPAVFQHPDTMGNAAAVSVKDKGDIWYIPDPTTENPSEHHTHLL